MKVDEEASNPKFSVCFVELASYLDEALFNGQEEDQDQDDQVQFEQPIEEEASKEDRGILSGNGNVETSDNRGVTPNSYDPRGLELPPSYDNYGHLEKLTNTTHTMDMDPMSRDSTGPNRRAAARRMIADKNVRDLSPRTQKLSQKLLKKPSNSKGP